MNRISVCDMEPNIKNLQMWAGQLYDKLIHIQEWQLHTGRRARNLAEDARNGNLNPKVIADFLDSIADDLLVK